MAVAATPSASTTHKGIVADFVKELTERHNPLAWQQYCADDFIHHFKVPGVPATRDGIEHLSRSILSAFPDVQVSIELLIEEGDLVVERATAEGTHLGEFNRIAPSGQRLRWTETHVYRLHAGRIVEHWPEIRLEMLLAQMARQTTYFQGPQSSLLSAGIAAVMTGLSRLYGTRADAHVRTDLERRERNRAVVCRYIDDFKNRQQFAVFPRLFAPDFRHHFNFPSLPNTMRTFVSVGQNFLAAFPDVRVEVEALIAEGAYVVERNRVSATHRGTFAGIPATGRAVTWTETHIYRLRDGKIVENWPQVNFERILMQIQG
jgi:steroid delta-isomerase-like uncharacterized protein